MYLHWERTWDLEKNRAVTSVIAVQGRIHTLKLFSNKIDSNSSVQMIYYWIFKRTLFVKNEIDIKQHLPKVYLKNKVEKGTYLFITHCRYRDVRKKGDVLEEIQKGCEPRIWSWKQAVNICRNAGGELPQFFSRKEQEELISKNIHRLFLHRSHVYLSQDCKWVGILS